MNYQACIAILGGIAASGHSTDNIKLKDADGNDIPAEDIKEIIEFLVDRGLLYRAGNILKITATGRELAPKVTKAGSA